MTNTKKKVKIVLIGAGSASFGRGTIADIMACNDLSNYDCTVALVDINEAALNKMAGLAELIRDYYHSPVKIEKTTDRTEALPGADYVIISVTQKRYELWEQDFRVPLAYGFRHVLGENGGPGALFHAIRNYEIVLPICHDIEKICPDALVLNFTNPESRILMAMKHLTKVNAVGLCHGVLGARNRAAELLGKDLNELNMVTGGLNHFFWVLEVKDANTGEDLYPLLRQRIQESCPPLVQKMVEVFDCFTYPSDDHIGEYLSFAYEFTGLLWHYGGECRKVAKEESPASDWRDDYLSGKRAVDDNLVRPGGEIAIDIIADILLDKNRWEPAVNVLNTGRYVDNLPTDAVVEVPAMVNATGIHPESVGPLPEALAAFCRTQISIQLLLLEAYRKRSKKLLLQALLLDPVVDSFKRAEEMLDYMMELQKDYLPAFS
ncbi:MAG: alpha-glucosidase/alpha-galactosidase [Candidatus Poribacteria bacterium]